MKKLTVEFTDEQVEWLTDLCLTVVLAEMAPVARPIEPADPPIAAAIIASCLHAMEPLPEPAAAPATTVTRPAATTSVEPGS